MTTTINPPFKPAKACRENAGEALAAAAKLLPRPSTTIITVSAEAHDEEIEALRAMIAALEADNRKLVNRLAYYRDKAHNNPLREVDRISHLRSLLTGGIPTACLQRESISELTEQLYEAKPLGTVKSVRA